MTNGPKTDILHHHYSADEFYLLPILLTATCIHMFILFMTIWSSIILKARHLFHATYKLFLITVFIHVNNSILIELQSLIFVLLSDDWSHFPQFPLSNLGHWRYRPERYTSKRPRIRGRGRNDVCVTFDIDCQRIHGDASPITPGFFHQISRFCLRLLRHLLLFIHSPKDTFRSRTSTLHLRVRSRIRIDHFTHCGMVHVHLLHVFHAQTLPGKGRILLPVFFILYTLVCVWAVYYHHCQSYHCRMGSGKGKK